MSSKIGKPAGGGGQQDQKKLYLNWANHYLRKSGATEQLLDLKDIADGKSLPSLLKAVGHEDIPRVDAAVPTDEERRANIESCVQFLQKTGLNCSTFNSKDLCDGKDRAILSLFYSLSQNKRKPMAQSSAPSGPGGLVPPGSKLIAPGSSRITGPPGDSHTLPVSRIARPVSPSLKVSLGVNGTTPATSPSSGGGSLVSSPGTGPGTGPSTGPSGTGIPASKSQTLPMGGRRTMGMGSSIKTSTIMERPVKQRKTQQRGNQEGAESGKSERKELEESAEEVKGDNNGDLGSSKEVKSDPESEEQSKKSKTKLSKFGSFSAGQTPGRKSSMPTSTAAIAEGAESVTPPSQSKLRGPGGLSRLQAPHKSKEASPSSSVSDENPAHSSAHKEPPERPQSRLKLMGSGRGVPLVADHPRPASQMGRRASGSTSNLTSSCEEPTRSESRLRMMRKGSDGAIKRHQVLQPPSKMTPPPALSSNLSSGDTKTSSLPRHLPKDSITSYKAPEAGQKKVEPGGSKNQSGDATGREERSLSSMATPGLKKPGSGLKKPGNMAGSGAIRTPSMPSGPQPTSAEGGRQEGVGLGGAQEKGAELRKAGTEKSSPVMARKLAPPKSHGDSRLVRPTSPSTRQKLLKVNHDPVSHTQSQPSGETRHFGLPAPGNRHHGSHLATHVKDKDGGGASSESTGGGVQIKEAVQDKEVACDSVVEDRAEERTALDKEQQEDGKKEQEKFKQDSCSSGTADTVENKLHDKEEELPVGVANHMRDESKEEEELKGSQAHLRFGRRISPEGMSHDEINIDKLDKLHTHDSDKEAEKGDVVSRKSPPKTHLSPSHHSPARKGHTHIVTTDTDDSESASSTDKEGGASHQDDGEEGRQSRSSSQEVFSPSRGSGVQRARSLSPKASHRLIPVPRGVARLRDMEMGVSGVGGVLQRSTSSDSTSSEGASPSHTHMGKPLKSSLRQKPGTKSRHSSSSSSSCADTSPRQTKVTISPRSSQLVYDPEETCLLPGHTHHSHHVALHLLPPDHGNMTKGLLGDRPTSFASVDSSTTSDSLSPSSSNHALYRRSPVSPIGAGMVRHSSLRLPGDSPEYRGNNRPRTPPPSDGVGSTPELIESFENQLTNMKEALTSKERMLHMYEHSMADLSTQMNMLKKSLEEKDNKIRHLTEKHWFDVESQSIMNDSRAPSVMDQHEGHDPLSDGYLSDSAMEQSKDKKKQKKWKFFNKSKKKEGSGGGGANGNPPMDHLSVSMETESVISGRSSKTAIRRTASKKKAPDLMSISEYLPPDNQMRDAEVKSTYTMMDVRGDFGIPPTQWEEDCSVKVYEDDGAGTRAEVVLMASTVDTPSQTTPSDDLYNDIFTRHVMGGAKFGRDSAASSLSSDSGHHDGVNGEEFILGTLSVPPDISWVSMDGKVEKILAHYISNIDSEKQLGLTEDSIYCYNVGEERRQMGNALLPPSTPYEALANKCTIKVFLKDAGQQSCDALAFRLLMGKESLQSYMGILQETHWLVVMGTKGTCKSSLVTGLAQHMSSWLKCEGEGEGMEDLMMGVVGGEITQFNLDKEGITAPLKYFKNDLPKRVQLQLQPPIIVLEDIYDCKDLEQLLAAAGGLAKKPYIIAALSSGTTKGIPLHQLLFHYQIRVVTCNPHADPIQGILTRSLKKQIYQQKAAAQSMDGLTEHLVNWIPYLLNHLNNFINKFHSNSVNLGPRVFMSCPLNQHAGELETWFISLWNHFIIPYLMGTIMAGIETYTADPMMDWVDVREWVLDTYPWHDSMSLNKLRTLNPEDVGWNHAVRPHQSRYIMVKDQEDTRSLLHHDTRSLLPDTRSLLNH